MDLFIFFSQYLLRLSFTSAAAQDRCVPVRERALLTDSTWWLYVDGRPRYDPGTYDSYCARSRNERSLHDLPLLDPARSPIRRYSDLLIANNAPHTRHRLYLRPRAHIDMTTFPSMRKSMPRKRTVHGRQRYDARPRRYVIGWIRRVLAGTMRSPRDCAPRSVWSLLFDQRRERVRGKEKGRAWRDSARI